MKCIGATLTVVSFAAFVRSRHTTPSISRLRESACCVTRPKNGCERDYSYCRSSNIENQNYSSTASYLKNIIPCDFTTKR